MLVDGQVQRCSRCTRLDMNCVPEVRRSSAKARLGPESRALLVDGPPSPALAGPSTLPLGVCSGVIPPLGSCSGFTPHLGSCSGVVPPLALVAPAVEPAPAVPDGDMDVINMVREVVTAGKPVEQRVLEQLVQIVVEVAKARDHWDRAPGALRS